MRDRRVKPADQSGRPVRTPCRQTDSGRLDADRELELLARVVAALRVPVTADVESGRPAPAR
ncbi:hypothetical protein GCM10009730_64110 [Streptomyces albidochromogenes]